MEQKYIIDKDLDAGTFTIKEVAETDVSKFTTLHHETFPLDAVGAAIEAGKEPLLNLFRNHDFFPPEFLANTMAEAIISLYNDTEKTNLKIALNDNDSLESHKEADLEAEATKDKEPVEVDALLDDDDEVKSTKEEVKSDEDTKK